jgi:hypothetical protein
MFTFKFRHDASLFHDPQVSWEEEIYALSVVMRVLSPMIPLLALGEGHLAKKLPVSLRYHDSSSASFPSTTKG